MRSPHTISSTVPPQFVQWNVVEYLTVRFPYLPAEAWRDWVAAGNVWRNGEPCTAESLITAGDFILCTMPEWEQPEANLNYTIVYEDEWLLGINKPANLRVHSGGKFLKMNLMYQLKYARQPAYPEADSINRLDADTSGVVVVGKGPDVVRAMGHLFATQAVQKEYVALVHGRPHPAEGTIDLPIGKYPASKVRFGTAADLLAPRTARTRYAITQTWGEAYSLLHLWPETGRTHQLRVHTAAIGHPIVGDKLYQSATDEEFIHWRRHPETAPDVKLIGRHALHCARTSFTHPITNEPCTIMAPLAEDLAAVVAQLDSE
ncbi:MAG: RluA family pseudouridine synthase [Chloroflexi bacterium]|nr:RluA family pseudouridine synthase [Chloroflexota bacterium]